MSKPARILWPPSSTSVGGDPTRPATGGDVGWACAATGTDTGTLTGRCAPASVVSEPNTTAVTGVRWGTGIATHASNRWPFGTIFGGFEAVFVQSTTPSP